METENTDDLDYNTFNTSIRKLDLLMNPSHGIMDQIKINVYARCTYSFIPRRHRTLNCATIKHLSEELTSI